MPNYSASLAASDSRRASHSAAEAAARGLELLLLGRARPTEAAAACRALLEDARHAGGADSPESIAALSALVVRFSRLAGIGGGLFEKAEADAAEALVGAVKRVRSAGLADPAAPLLSEGALEALADAALLPNPADPRAALNRLAGALGLCELDAPAQALRGMPAALRLRARLCARAAGEEAKRALRRAAEAAEAAYGKPGDRHARGPETPEESDAAESSIEAALAPLAAAADALSARLLAFAAKREGEAAHSLDALAALSEADAMLDAALYAPVVEAMPPVTPGRVAGALALLNALGRLLEASKPLRMPTARFLSERARHAWLASKSYADVHEKDAPGWRGALRLALAAHAALAADDGRSAPGGGLRLPADDESRAMEMVRICRVVADVLAKASTRVDAEAGRGSPDSAGSFAEAAAAGDLAALEWAAAQRCSRSLMRLMLHRMGLSPFSRSDAVEILRRLALIGAKELLTPGLDELEALANRGGPALEALSPWAAFAASDAAESAFDEGCAAAAMGTAALARRAGPALMRLRRTALRFLALPQVEAAFGRTPHYWMRRAALDGAFALPEDRRPALVCAEVDERAAAGGEEQGNAADAAPVDPAAPRRAEAQRVFGFARRAAEASSGLKLEDGLPQAAADCLLSCAAALAFDALRAFAIRMSNEGRDQDEWDFFIRACSGRPYPPPYSGQVRAAADAAAKLLIEAQAAPAAAAGRQAVESWLSSAAGTAMVYCAAGDAPAAALWAEKSLAAYGALAGGPASFESELAMGSVMTALHRYRAAFMHFAAAWRLAKRGSGEAELAAFRACCCRQAADYAEWKGGWSRRLAELAPAWTAPFGRARRLLGRLDAFPVVEAAPEAGRAGGTSVRWLVTAGASAAADAFSAVRARCGGGPSLRCEYAMPLEADEGTEAEDSDGSLELPAWASETAAPNARLSSVLFPEADWFRRLGGRAAPEDGRFSPEGIDPALLAHAFALGSPGDPGLWAKAFAKAPGAAWALEALHLAADVLSSESVAMPNADSERAAGEAAGEAEGGAKADGALEHALEAAASAPQLLSVPQLDGRPAKLFGPQADAGGGGEGEARSGGAGFAALLAVPAGLLKEELRAAGLSAPKTLMTAADPRLPFLLAKLADESSLAAGGLEGWLEAELEKLGRGRSAEVPDGEDEDAGEKAPTPEGDALRPAAVKIVIPLYAEEADFVRLFDAEAFLRRAREAAAPLLPVRAGRPNVCEGEDRRSVLRPSDVREVIPPPLGQSWCAITESVLREGMVHAGIRFDLLPGEGMGSPDGRRDSGWFFMTKGDLERLCGRPEEDAADAASGAPGAYMAGLPGAGGSAASAVEPAALPQIYGGALNVPATLEPGLRFAAELPPGTVILREESGEFRAVDPADVFPEGFVFAMGNGDWYDPRTGRREKPFGPAAAEAGARRAGEGGDSSSGFSGPSGFDGPGFVGNA